jgi:hypothetical protein
MLPDEEPHRPESVPLDSLLTELVQWDNPHFWEMEQSDNHWPEVASFLPHTCLDLD